MKALRRAVRTLVQLVAAGSLTALVDLVAGGLSATQAAVVLTTWGVVVSFAHNFAEDSGWIPSTK